MRDNDRIAYLGANIPNPFFGLLPSTAAAALQGANIARERLLRPYPEFDAVNTTTNEGWSWYHALQVTLQRRFAAGYTISGAYTYSKFTEATEFLNAADPEPWEGISSVDTPHRLSVNGIWEAPVRPRRRKFGTDVERRSSRRSSAAGSSRGSTPTRAGSRLGFGNIIFTGDFDDIASARGASQSLARWFNTDAGFNKVSTQQLGSNVRTFPLRLENVRIRRREQRRRVAHQEHAIAGTTLELRFDSLNAFNHPLFPRGPALPPGSSRRRRRPISALGLLGAENYARRMQVSVKFLF